ncbi:ATP-binding protein [Ramlibacter solisilvae]|uniref:ATP-binding protein n=1 Tax=Ramlibacter tataouinensis TaxID=94132 RepID=UPI0009EF435F|nr:ATP-binding protein [Ramlibacter tataouinensis]
MKELLHPPDAPALLESMRSMGYTSGSALADLIDNSIAAQAKLVEIEFRSTPRAYVAILDDGEGMSADVLERSMRHGSTNPVLRRDLQDLGRYGLGLKTASLSQCRKLTVVSIRDRVISGYCWDLDLVSTRKAWVLIQLDPEELLRLPHVGELTQRKSGTLVLWEELDRLAAGYETVDAALGQQMSTVRSHLALVFHRYLSGEHGLKRLRICINKNELEPVDPFLESHRSTQRLADDSFAVEGSRVSVKPFILPHLNKLSRPEIERAGGSEGLRHQQGFYVYRNRRLIVWGTWFGLARKDELSKLARVRVDISNSLDHLWTVDIKKSTAVPPEAVRRNLRRTIERIRGASGRTLTFRGRQANLELITPGWTEMVDRDGVRFDINREHPAIRSLRAHLESTEERLLDNLLRILESSFPVQVLYSRLAGDSRHHDATHLGEAAFREMVETVLDGWAPGDPARLAFLTNLHLIEPFSSRPDLAKRIGLEKLEKSEDA